jgi:hypothetical protein
MLVPEVSQGAYVELGAVSKACAEAIATLGEAHDVVVIGPGQFSRNHPSDAAGTFAGFGVDVRAGGTGPTTLPPTLTLAAWLLETHLGRQPKRYVEIAASDGFLMWDAIGEALATTYENDLGILVVGGGSACRTEKAPGAYDDRADRFDANVAQALSEGDVNGLLDLDDDLAMHLKADGLPVWKTAAFAWLRSREPKPRLLTNESPYGVGYFVATWT